jgi:DNA-binding response OmpR family regulator
VTGVLALTADPELRAQLTDCGDRAGVRLSVYGDLATARAAAKNADLVLLGADLAPAAAAPTSRSEPG